MLYFFSQEFTIKLKEPVPQPSKHEGKEWYNPHVTRQQAEDLLRKVPHDGAFLVRPSDYDHNSFAISFRYVVTHLKVSFLH